MKVFWSWQSDTPGRIGRHFVRDTLEHAVEQLKQPSVVEEPHERENREALHLDHDRKGVRGSPPLADTILAKIDAAEVFIADVTPVALVPGDSPEASPKKRNINPNVAIELGYAMKVLDRDILMVMNEHYGGRETLPFDLAHLGGPIMYSLAPEASADKIRSEAGALRSQLLEALRPYLQQSNRAVAAHTPIPTTLTRAAYFQSGEMLATFGEGSDNESFAYDTGEGTYLRLMPTTAQQIVPIATLLSQLRSSTLRPLYRDHGEPTANKYGAITCDFVPKTARLKGSTQVFPNKEIWGFTVGFVLNALEENALPVGGFERALRKALPAYVSFMEDALKVPLPYRVEAGAVGIAGRALVGETQDSAGTIYENEFHSSHVIGETSRLAVEEALLRIFEDLFAMAGTTRPPGLFGFP